MISYDSVSFSERVVYPIPQIINTAIYKVLKLPLTRDLSPLPSLVDYYRVLIEQEEQDSKVLD